MTVEAYGDITRSLTLEERLARIAAAHDPLERLLEAGELAQAAIDAEFAKRGCDGDGEVQRWATGLVWSGGGVRAGGVPEQRAAAWPPHSRLTSKLPEGFAYYAVYPELYERAAQRAGLKTRKRIVIGIRSIGVTLGAVVANAVDADDFFTVRPVGHPFRRTLALDESLRRRLDPEAQVFVVDEGPGLSGSSFAAVAEALPNGDVVFLPSHENPPGPQAEPRVRALWERTPKLYEPFAFDPRWIEPLIGRVESVVELSAGAWRAFAGIEAPAWITHERRKYLLDANGKQWLAKFAGLGAYGREKLEKAQRLAARRLVPPVAGLANGFLVTKWCEGSAPTDRAALVDAIGRYLEAVAQERAPSWRSSAPIAPFDSELVDVDNRMHPWEWLATPAGDVLKCDAVDHSSAHDGVGVQDIAWDVAGAIVEHALTGDELESIRRRVVTTDAKVAFFTRAYAEKQEAIFRQAAAESAAAEAARLSARAELYKLGVGRGLSASPSLRTGLADLPHPALQLMVRARRDAYT